MALLSMRRSAAAVDPHPFRTTSGGTADTYGRSAASSYQAGCAAPPPPRPMCQSQPIPQVVVANSGASAGSVLLSSLAGSFIGSELSQAIHHDRDDEAQDSGGIDISWGSDDSDTSFSCGD